MPARCLENRRSRPEHGGSRPVTPELVTLFHSSSYFKPYRCPFDTHVSCSFSFSSPSHSPSPPSPVAAAAAACYALLFATGVAAAAKLALIDRVCYHLPSHTQLRLTFEKHSHDPNSSSGHAQQGQRAGGCRAWKVSSENVRECVVELIEGQQEHSSRNQAILVACKKGGC